VRQRELPLQFVNPARLNELLEHADVVVLEYMFIRMRRGHHGGNRK
jgi:hypothetical protein